MRGHVPAMTSVYGGDWFSPPTLLTLVSLVAAVPRTSCLLSVSFWSCSLFFPFHSRAAGTTDGRRHRRVQLHSGSGAQTQAISLEQPTLLACCAVSLALFLAFYGLDIFEALGLLWNISDLS